MNSSTSSALPPYAVPGIQPLRVNEEGRHVEYRGHQLIRTPPVAAVFARVPETFLPLTEGEPLRREELCAALDVSSRDGLAWIVGLGDAVKSMVDSGGDFVDDDLIEEALAAQPDVVEVYHVDREVFDVVLGRFLRADEMFARWLDAITAAHREFALRLGVELPY
ncbi:hypothetical protein [Micromonospora sp. U21]|uniref:hypothetical protein n=1 Tax=Micromonospora sp. U21 TaxID=2824899 RepID=UPI001B3805E6|nr:hypothetical protein [Micromonospora sp. U21]MBQ0902044.1 hypothetical protein [Micromonospora sp. U21]